MLCALAFAILLRNLLPSAVSRDREAHLVHRLCRRDFMRPRRGQAADLDATTRHLFRGRANRRDVQQRRSLSGVDRDADLGRAVRAAPRAQPRRLRSLQQRHRSLRRSRHGPTPARPARLLDRDRVVRVLEAADEQHLVRVGRRAVAAVRPAAQPAAGHRRRGGAAARRSHPAVCLPCERRRSARCELRGLAGAGEQPAQRLRLARLLAGIRRVLAFRHQHRTVDQRQPPLLQLRRRLWGSGEWQADHRRLRVRLQLAQPAQSRRTGQQGADARGARLRDVEAGAVDHQLLADAARQCGQRDHLRRRRRSAAGRHQRQCRRRQVRGSRAIRRGGRSSTERPACTSATPSSRAFRD